MGKASQHREKFSKPYLTSIERQVNAKGFQKETYIYDDDSHLAIRIRPQQTFTECTFCLYERIRIQGQPKSHLYKRLLMKVGEARNANIPVSELRQKADSLYLDIQKGQDPLLLAQLEANKQAEAEKMAGAMRSFRDMVFGTPIDKAGRERERLADGFIADRRPSASYLQDIHGKCVVLLDRLLDEPLYLITVEQVKSIYLLKVGKGQTQLNNAMRVFRSVWNWAQNKYYESDLFLSNPISRAMKQLGVNINKTNRRKVRLNDSDFKSYIDAVLKLRDHDHSSAFRNGRDVLLFILFSSVRIAGATRIKIKDVNLEKKIFTVVKKGGEAVDLPLNSVTQAIVRNRMKNLPGDAAYLFPGIAGREHYRDTKKARDIVKVISGVSLTNHDLRRTYKSIGTELGINFNLVDELLCHSREGVDAHYVHPSMDALRAASQKVADYIVERSGLNVIDKLNEVW